ncbi:MAG: 50S ribosomal protein L35 [Candidatus Cloacimonetes bacterium]|nr:50S ribosomal protein L35 [Candidatus Cloacimonadota bacterium]
MPKQKTKKSFKKRIKITGRGKLLRGDVGMSHLKTKKSSKRKRRKSGRTEIAKGDKKRLKKLLGC